MSLASDLQAVFDTPPATSAAAATGMANAISSAMAGLPIGAIIPAYLSAGDVSTYFDGTGLGKTGRWSGFAICNGANGTPSLNGKFPRFSAASAGATGGADSSAHTHSVDVAAFTGTSGSEASHTHSVDVAAYTGDSGAEASHTHTGPSHQHVLPFSCRYSDDLAFRTDGVATAYDAEFGIEYDSTSVPSVPFENKSLSSAGAAYLALSKAAGTGNTGAGSSHLHTINHDHGAVTSAAGSSHAHSIDHDHPSVTSGAASATENRPAFYELVPVMRVT